MLFCMRVMVGVIILYDHVHPVGAFAKTSKIDVSALILDLKLIFLPSIKCRNAPFRAVWSPDLSGTRMCLPVNRLLSCLQMKGCIKVLKEQPSNSVEGLLNALRWVRMPG